MRGGDISDRRPPRWLVQFEGVVARRPPERDLEFKLAVRFRRWARAVGTYEVEPHVQRVLNDLYWRRDYRFEVFTTLGPEFAGAVEEYLDRVSLPVRAVFHREAVALARELVFMPDVVYVVHSHTESPLIYGPRGLLVNDPERLQL